MQLRWNFKLKPNDTQIVQMSEWLITLRKHRNYALRERESGYTTNNQDAETLITYAWGSFCDIESRVEYGSCCPLTCPVIKHGVVPIDLTMALKTTKKNGIIKWDSASGIQMKRTTQLRYEQILVISTQMSYNATLLNLIQHLRISGNMGEVFLIISEF